MFPGGGPARGPNLRVQKTFLFWVAPQESEGRAQQRPQSAREASPVRRKEEEQGILQGQESGHHVVRRSQFAARSPWTRPSAPGCGDTMVEIQMLCRMSNSEVVPFVETNMELPRRKARNLHKNNSKVKGTNIRAL